MINRNTLFHDIGWQKLLAIQEKADSFIELNPQLTSTQKEIAWEAYYHGQACGAVQGVLHIAQRMQKAGYANDVIVDITQLSISDLMLWQETLIQQEGRD